MSEGADAPPASELRDEHGVVFVVAEVTVVSRPRFVVERDEVAAGMTIGTIRYTAAVYAQRSMMARISRGGSYESIDLVDAYHPQTILAHDMNGVWLPVAHGPRCPCGSNDSLATRWRNS